MGSENDQTLAIATSVLQKEADALLAVSRSLGKSFVDAVETIITAKGRVICSGIGKSGHVARKLAATLSSTGTPAYFIHPTEASHGDLGMIMADDVVIALSRSGETSELTDLVGHSRRFSVPLIAFTFKLESTLGNAADIVIDFPEADEACDVVAAPTTSTTMMMALGDALAVALLTRRGFDASKFKTLHPGGQLGAMLLAAGDLMTDPEDTPLVSESTELPEVFETLTRCGLGCVGVVDDNNVLTGIITDGDIRRLFIAKREAKVARDAMTISPKTVSVSSLAADCLRVMNTNKITQIFVLDGARRPLGVVHMHAVLKAGLI